MQKAKSSTSEHRNDAEHGGETVLPISLSCSQQGSPGCEQVLGALEKGGPSDIGSESESGGFMLASIRTVDSLLQAWSAPSFIKGDLKGIIRLLGFFSASPSTPPFLKPVLNGVNESLPRARTGGELKGDLYVASRSSCCHSGGSGATEESVFATKMGPRIRHCEESPRPLAEGTTWQSGGGVTSSNHVCGGIFMFYGARCKRPWPIVSITRDSDHARKRSFQLRAVSSILPLSPMTKGSGWRSRFRR